jgi:L-gulonate 3-dehydrogenase
MSMRSKVAIVGAGLVGSGWAIVFARAGFPVALYDAQAGAAALGRGVIAQNLADLKVNGLIDDPDGILGRITVAPDLSSALDGAVYVQESVFERADVKRAIFSEIDALIGPTTLVGSSSSGIPASVYTDHVGCRARCLVAHPVNPPYLAPIVELVPSPWTAPETLASVRALMEEVGQKPVQLAREIEGFLLNRLQAVLLMEAWRLVDAGLATVEDIDRTVKEGLGLRWSFMGPFETIDLNAPGGIADYAQRLGPLYQRIAASAEVHDVWDEAIIAKVEAQRRALLPAAALGARSLWRDRELMALARHKQSREGETS